MSFPVKEQIVQAVVAALETIAGVEVTRPRRTGETFAPRHRGIAVIQSAERRESEHDLVGNPDAMGWRLPIACDAIIRLSEHDSTPMDQSLNILEADIRKALMADPTFGGLAITSELGDSEYSDAGNGVEGVTVWIEISYRVASNDPYVNMI